MAEVQERLTMLVSVVLQDALLRDIKLNVFIIPAH